MEITTIKGEMNEMATKKQSVNSIGREGAKLLGDALMVNATLTEMNLAGDRKEIVRSLIVLYMG